MSRRGIFAALLATAAGIVVARLMLANELRDPGAGDVALVLFVGWSFVASGVVALNLRPDNPIGRAMVVTGFLRFAAALEWSHVSLLYSIGASLQPAYLVGIVYVVLTFPRGRLLTLFERWLFVTLVVAAGPLHIAWLMSGAQRQPGFCANCPDYLFELAGAVPVAWTLEMTHGLIGVAGGAIAIGVLVGRWRHASAPLRFAIAPILWVGAAALATGVFWMITGLLGDPLGRAPARAMELMLGLVAVAFLVGVARTRLARAAVADLVIELGDSSASGKLQAVLGRALHDPSLRVVYWLSDEEGFVDARGRSIDVVVDDGRAVTMIERDGSRIAALVHDPATLEDEQLAQSVSAAAALQLENERLQVELLGQLEQAEVSHAQIVETSEALAAERRQLVLLGGLVEAGRRVRVAKDEESVVSEAVGTVADALGYPLRVGLMDDGLLRYPAQWIVGPWDVAVPLSIPDHPIEVADASGPLLIMPLTVQGRPAGTLEVRQPGGGVSVRERALLEAAADQLSVTLENTRLYHRLHRLFHHYVAPEVASTLMGDDRRAELGGGIVETTVLFADLLGFTSFSERVAHPQEVVTLLNTYFSVAVPVIRQEGGTLDKFVGDALMALFNTPVLQPDHAHRAARAGLRLQQAVEELTASHPDWPLFRVGINTGPALVGNIGSEDVRNFTAVGDAVNLASRLESMAEAGQVVVSSTTYALIRHVADVRPLGPVQVKGKVEPVEAFALVGLREDTPDG